MDEPNAAKELKAAKDFLQSEKWEDAIASFKNFERACTEETSSEFYFQKSVKAAHEGLNHEAIEYTCRTLAVEPNHINAQRNISVLLKRIKAFDDALKFAERYIKENPLCKFGHNTIGTILTEIGAHQEAINAFKESLRLDPKYAHANLNLSNEYHIQANIDMAYIYMSKAINSEPNSAGSWLDALTHFRRVCDFNAIDNIDWWKVIDETKNFDISNTFLQVLTLTENIKDGKNLSRIAKRCGKLHTKSGQSSANESQQKHEMSQNKGKHIIRIGFISGDFRDHSVARFIWPLFEYINRSKIELYCYSTYQSNDEWGDKFRASATKFRDIGNLSPVRLSNTIRKDQIDILFDLTGFTKGSRSSTFAHRSAKAQISWLGFPGTTGLPEMDYLLVDRYLAPKATSSTSEELLITEGTSVCFAGIDEVPITDTIPELKRGHLTIGSLNNSYKITRNTIKRWSNVLRELPSSKFLFVRREFQSFYLRKNIIEEFSRNGVDSTRIFFYNNRLENRHYLDCYNEIDMTLDTYPVTGGTTTTDALWMGVPVIALEGPHIHQRVCSAILNHAGHEEWIAQTDIEFQKKAINLAMDQEKRIQLRKTLRQEVRNSLLCNPEQFAKDFTKTITKLLES